MRHLKKKFFIKPSKPGDDLKNVLASAQVLDLKDYNKFKQQTPDLFGVIQTVGNELIQAFHYKSNNIDYFIPEPHPIVIYFEIGRHYYNHIASTREKLFEELNQGNSNVYRTQARFYNFYSNGSACVTFLFTALEAFVNKLIPSDYEYSKVVNGNIEVYNQIKIQRHLQFYEKVRLVLPDITKRAFHIEKSHKFDSIKKLKNFRDEIMHTKLINKTTPNFYKGLFTTALDFDYETTLFVARDFINYYEPNLIEECNCGKDY